MGGRALFYPASELARFPAAWNGRPVPFFHPTEQDENGQVIPVSANSPGVLQRESVGILFHAWYEEEKRALRAEIWVDEERVRRKDPGLLSSLEKGEKIEVSTGLWGDIEDVGGVWNGEPYEAIFRNYRPDHLALLPRGEGACNIQDGCGVFNQAEQKGGDTMEGAEKPTPGKIRRVLNYLSWLTGKKGDEILAGMGLTLNEEFSHDACRMKLQEMMDGMDTWDHYNIVREVYDNYFIFESIGIGEGMPRKMMKMGYSMDKNGKMMMEGEAEEVREKKTYVPVKANAGPGVENNQEQEETIDVDKTATVTSLIANQGNRFAEADRTWLMSLSEEQLAKLMPEEKKEAVPALQANCDSCTQKKAEAPKAHTVAEYVAQAPREFQPVLNRALKHEEERKAALVSSLMANERNPFSQEQLAAKEVDELEALAALAGEPYRPQEPAFNYALQGGGYQANYGQYDDIPPSLDD